MYIRSIIPMLILLPFFISFLATVIAVIDKEGSKIRRRKKRFQMYSGPLEVQFLFIFLYTYEKVIYKAINSSSVHSNPYYNTICYDIGNHVICIIYNMIISIIQVQINVIHYNNHFLQFQDNESLYSLLLAARPKNNSIQGGME